MKRGTKKIVWVVLIGVVAYFVIKPFKTAVDKVLASFKGGAAGTGTTTPTS